LTNATQKASTIESTQVPTIECLENLAVKMQEQTSSKFERFFLPSLGVFSLIVMGFFVVIYSITQDMSRLANTMDYSMSKNMKSMAVSVDTMSGNMSQMTSSIKSMESSFVSVNESVETIASKLDNLDTMSADLAQMNTKMDILEPMLINMEEMNKNMTTMVYSMQWMQHDISTMRASFARPMNMINSMPFPF
jgi:methyl-accepting chemotaxis protein